MKKILFIITTYIHKLIVYTMLFGFLLPEKYLIYFLLLGIIVYLLLKFNNDKCILTEFQNYLENKQNNKKTFIEYMFKEFRIYLRRNELNFIHKFIQISWIIGILRYFKFIKN